MSEHDLSDQERLENDAVAAYLDAGEAADPMHYPELADFIADVDVVRRWTAPLREAAHLARTASADPAETIDSDRVKALKLAQVASFGDYEVVAALPPGGMGVVYKARHLKLQRLVALKMILAGDRASPKQIADFLREARAVARMHHPNIVQIHDIGEREGRPYFSMEYVEGGSLAQRLEGAPPSDMEAAQLVALLARAVHYAHGRGIVHRDLKPANILLTSDGVLKIADFGLAKFLDDDLGNTVDGAILGTAPYMAPEQAAGRTREIGRPADIYALGAILYELLTGRPPFRGETLHETLHQVMENAPVKPHLRNPRVDRSLEAICLMCLEKAPKDRYASAEALAEDLARFLDGERPLAHKGVVGVWIRTVVKETRYTEVMRLWSGVWMGLAVNGFILAVAQCLLLWNQVQDFAPYHCLWIVKMFGDLGWAWFVRVRGGPPPLPVERQLVQIWMFFWVNHFLVAWLYQRSGGTVSGFLPITGMEMAVTLGSMAAILGGSFYVSAALCVVMALLDALGPGAGTLFAAVVNVPYFFSLGWKHSRRMPGR